MKTCYFDRESRSILDLCEYGPLPLATHRLITRINVPIGHRGKGHASRLLTKVCEIADEEGITLVLEIQPSDGLSFAQLSDWYQRHGFRAVGGMYTRKPQGTNK